MSDTTVNPATSPVVTVQRRPRIKDALAQGICDGTTSVVKIVDSAAEVVNACAVRVKLHNISTAADIIDEVGLDKVTQAQELISKL